MGQCHQGIAIKAHHGFESRQIGFEKGAVDTVAGIVDQQMIPVSSQGRGYKRDTRVGRQIRHLECMLAFTQLRHQFLQAFLIAGGCRNGVALSRQPMGKSPADAFTGPGDHYLFLDGCHCIPLSFHRPGKKRHERVLPAEIIIT